MVQRTLGLDSRGALEWIAALIGVPLDRPWTREERAEWGRRRRAAEAEARELVSWADGLIEVLRENRNTYLAAYHRAKNFILRHGVDHPAFETAADLYEISEQKIQDADRRIDLLTRAEFSTMLPFFRQRQQRSEAA